MADVPSADRRGWGPPCGGRMVTVRPLGMTLPVRAEVAVIFERFVLEAEEKGCRFNRRRDDWGYNCRHIKSDPSLPWSNHAWGLAVDLDATQNPMVDRLVTTFPGWIDELAERYGLRWGGNYTGRLKDAMHFEFVGTPDDARRITERLKARDRKEGLMGVEFKDRAELEAFIQDAVYGPGKGTPRVEGTVNAGQVVETAATAARAAKTSADKAVAAVADLRKLVEGLVLRGGGENPTGRLP